MPRPDTVTVFFDGSCAVCALEMGKLAARDHGGRLALVDISASGFDAGRHGFDLAALDAEIHAIGPDGTVLRGMAALRLAYEAVGLGRLLGFTASRPLKPGFDAAYRLFARNRRAISATLKPLIEAVAAGRARRAAERIDRCAGGSCTPPAPGTAPKRSTP